MDNIATPNRLWDIHDVAFFLNVGAGKARTITKTNGFPGTKIKHRWHPSDVEKWARLQDTNHISNPPKQKTMDDIVRGLQRNKHPVVSVD